MESWKCKEKEQKRKKGLVFWENNHQLNHIAYLYAYDFNVL